MTTKDLDVKSAALENLRAQWQASLLPRVEAKVADAAAHAQKAVTDTLKNTTDGRASILKINASPSYKAALSRLDELWIWLAGAGETSLKGKVRDAREQFYRQAAQLFFPLIPAELRSRRDPEPTAAQVRTIRAAAVHGYDPRNELAGPINAAKHRLKAAVEVAGRQAQDSALGAKPIDQWERQTTRSLSQVVITLLNDSVEYCDTMAGRELIAEEFIEEVA